MTRSLAACPRPAWASIEPGGRWAWRGSCCSAGARRDVTGTPTAAPAAAPPSATAAPPEALTAAPTESADASPSTDGCRVSISGRSVRMSGGGRVRTVNGAHEFACRTGPLVAVQSVDAGGVRFRLDDASVLVAADATGQVGPYRITVRELAAPAAEFDVVSTG